MENLIMLSSFSRALAAILALMLPLSLPSQSSYVAPYSFTTESGLSSGATDGTGSAARFFLPSDTATDSTGNIYVADTNNHTIRKITSGGVVTTMAGLAGYVGSNDGVGSAARFDYPGSVAVDAGGIVYVADTINHTIRKIAPDGTVTTLAGSAGVAGSIDGVGTAARFNQPAGVEVDAAGNVFVADTSNNMIRKITSGGVVTTLAGSTLAGSVDGTGTAASFRNPRAIGVDAAGNIYVA
ncbi:MAG: hypothetical protein JWM35_2264, partial [Verrucomicrobia bacterium]|nr:hypothetical protein [Verrucomicrobiota bacterium]